MRDPRAVLEKALGTLVLFEMIGPEPDSRRRVDHARTLAGNGKSLAENDDSNVITGSKKAHVGASDCARARRTLPVSLRRMKREDRAVALLATTAAQAGDYSYAVSRYNSVVGALARPHSTDGAVECARHVADGNVRFMNGSPSLRRRRSMVLCI